jgi:hypothetical protein
MSIIASSRAISMCMLFSSALVVVLGIVVWLTSPESSRVGTTLGVVGAVLLVFALQSWYIRTARRRRGRGPHEEQRRD